MANSFFRFKEFTVFQDLSAMKVTTDSCLFGAWCALEIQKLHCSQILDIGTGTGLLSLMIAQKNKIKIDAVEMDEKTASQASTNISISPWKDSISIFNSDIRHHTGKYDCIISNPPFYENQLRSPDSRNNIAHHSSKLTLIDLAQCVDKMLSNNGYLFLLLPFNRAAEVEKIILTLNFFIHKTIVVKQSTEHSPFRIMIIAAKTIKNDPEIEFLSIKNGQDYTDSFKSLLKDYYLYL